MLTLASLQSPSEVLRPLKGNGSILRPSIDFIKMLVGPAKVNAVFCSEVIIDISSTDVDESKEIVLFEFASLSSNSSLRTTRMSVKGRIR